VTVPLADTPDAPGNLLAPEPAVRTGAQIGYARVSTSGQLLDRQQHALAEAGCLRVFADKLSGKNAHRPELAACLDYLRPGDTLVVPSLDRLSRSLADLIAIVGTLRRRGVGFKSLHEALDTTTPGGRLVFHVFAALAEFIRELIVEGTREGLDAARTRGVRLGRPPAMTAEQIRHARDLLTRPDNTVSSIARLLGVSRATIYKYVPEVNTGRVAAALPPGQSRGLSNNGTASGDSELQTAGLPRLAVLISKECRRPSGSACWQPRRWQWWLSQRVSGLPVRPAVSLLPPIPGGSQLWRLPTVGACRSASSGHQERWLARQVSDVARGRGAARAVDLGRAGAARGRRGLREREKTLPCGGALGMFWAMSREPAVFSADVRAGWPAATCGRTWRAAALPGADRAGSWRGAQSWR
jgi:DNA invertase Pin-like site-specific DNA recombinase